MRVRRCAHAPQHYLIVFNIATDMLREFQTFLAGQTQPEFVHTKRAILQLLPTLDMSLTKNPGVNSYQMNCKCPLSHRNGNGIAIPFHGAVRVLHWVNYLRHLQSAVEHQESMEISKVRAA